MEYLFCMIDFSKNNGLVPAIAQDAETNEVLMLGYMNEEAFSLTRSTQTAHYYSRSRNRIWKKGESSGNIQKVLEIRIDCDLDTILLKVKQHGGAACHMGYKSCFYRKLENDGALIIDKIRVFDPERVYNK